jgi:protocatechuate 3,4-dioxygenase alpha subunit
MTGSARLIATASQTVGPFFHFGLAAHVALGRIAAAGAPGEHIQLRVCVLDGAGAPVPDALIELYHADADGQYPQPGATGAAFVGFGRLPTDAEGCCTFQTIKPGPVRTGTSVQAPHVNVCLLSRGLLRQIYTRIYFAGDPELAADPIFGVVPADRRHTLLARAAPADPTTWELTIRLQGDDETVFFDL